MSNNYMPAKDADFTAWADTFIAYLEPNIAHFGLVVGDLVPFADHHPEWDTLLAQHYTAQATAQSYCSAKNEERKAFDTVIRALVKKINASPNTTDADREALGIKTAAPQVPAGASVDKPLGLIDVNARLKHVIRIRNTNGSTVSRSRPVGAIGCEIWRTVGTLPSGAGDGELAAVAYKSPFSLEYAPDDAGKTVYYMLRWVNREGQIGNWSETEAATIAA